MNFIKADIEGYEWRALQGMKNLLKRNANIRASICTYHKADDAEQFKAFFEQMDFDVHFSRGYLVWPTEPYLRKGVLRAGKQK